MHSGLDNGAEATLRQVAYYLLSDIDLLCAYCRGVRSWRQIERLCHADIAFKVACAGDIPDHTTIARFRTVPRDAFAGLFMQVLLIAAEADAQLRERSLLYVAASRARDELVVTWSKVDGQSPLLRVGGGKDGFAIQVGKDGRGAALGR